MTKAEALAVISRYPAMGGKSQLNILKKALAHMGNPHLRYPCVHVAGTNGKGSVCAFLQEIFQKNGYRTGMFTSPFLADFSERIRIDGLPISDELLTKCVLGTKAAVEKLPREEQEHISQFGFVTLVMFLAYAQSNVALALLETGLGGALDPTNVCRPLLSIITTIGLDHTRVLGNTAEEIAENKAGIIKNNIPAVTAPASDAVNAIFQKQAEKVSAPLLAIRQEDVQVQESGIDGVVFTYKGETYRLSMRGRHQAVNAALALEGTMLLKRLGWRTEHVKESLKSCKWAGRLEMLHAQPFVLLDGAHNPQGAQSLADWAKEALTAAKRKIIIVTAFAQDKDIPSMVKILSGIATESIVTAFAGERCAPGEYTAQLFLREGIPSEIIADPVKALLQACAKAGREDAVLVCGSLFLIGELKWREMEWKEKLCLQS